MAEEEALVELQGGARRASRARLAGTSELLSSTGPAQVVQDGSQEVLQKQVRGCHVGGEKHGAELQDPEEPHTPTLPEAP